MTGICVFPAVKLKGSCLKATGVRVEWKSHLTANLAREKLNTKLCVILAGYTPTNNHSLLYSSLQEKKVCSPSLMNCWL